MKKKLSILGAGESGTGAAILAKKQGFDVFVSDYGKISLKYKNVLSNFNITYEEGKHTEEMVLRAEEMIKSPGIPENVPIVKEFKKMGKKVISDIEFAGRYTNAKMIGITGSNGKTTTTLLTYHILKNAGLNVGLAGNVGDSFAWQVAEKDFDIYVLEISSFQLDTMFNFKADIAIITNITPDHLDRYDGSFEKYTASKFRILQNQQTDDHFIFCDDDHVVVKEIEKHKVVAKKHPFSLHKQLEQEAYIDKNEMVIKTNDKTFTMNINELALQGKHNIYNSMAASVASRILDIKKDILKQSLSDFQNVEHRLEYVTNVHGIEFINDSKATNVNATWYALESMQKPVIWIAGGIDKGNDYNILKGIVEKKVKAIVCLGKDNKRLIEAFSETVEVIVDTDNIEDAVKSAYYLGHPGYVALLSPACASFDLFDNYVDRGKQFKQKAKEL